MAQTFKSFAILALVAPGLERELAFFGNTKRNAGSTEMTNKEDLLAQVEEILDSLESNKEQDGKNRIIFREN